MISTNNDTTILLQKAQVLTQTTPEGQYCCNGWFLLVIIIVTGVIGGAINYLLSEFEPVENKSSQEGVKKVRFSRKLLLQILLGICGAALIPLFLYLTSSKLLEKCDNCFFVYFVFAGYCFIGAIFSRALLDNLAKRLDLEKFKQTIKKEENEIKSAQKKANEAEKFIEQNYFQEEDSDDSLSDQNIPVKRSKVKEELEQSDEIKSTSQQDDKENITYAIRVLDELRNPKYKDRSINGLSKRTKIDKDTVVAILNAFSRLDLVREVEWYGRKFYRLTEKGRRVDFVD